jgi:hypothetical protein
MEKDMAVAALIVALCSLFAASASAYFTRDATRTAYKTNRLRATFDFLDELNRRALDLFALEIPYQRQKVLDETRAGK